MIRTPMVFTTRDQTPNEARLTCRICGSELFVSFHEVAGMVRASRRARCTFEVCCTPCAGGKETR